MGLGEAFESAILGIFFVLILATIIQAIWPQLSAILLNTEVFGSTGLVTLGIVSLLVLVFVVAIIMKIFRDTREKRQQLGNLFNRGNDLEE